MTIRTRTPVHAAHDIVRGPHTVIANGAHGKVVDSHRSWFETTYTVEFTAIRKHRRMPIRLVGLTEGDVQPD